MTVYRRNPLLMTVMGANPGRRVRRPDDAIDKAISNAWHRLMSGVVVPILDIPRIFRDVKLEVAHGMPVEQAVMAVGERYRVQSNGGVEGFFVMGTHTSVAWYPTRQEAEDMARKMNYRGGTHYTVEAAGPTGTHGRRVTLRRNPSLAASLAGGMAGAIVTHALSNPGGPAFLVVDSRSGVVQYRKAASGMGTQAFNAAHERARDMADKLGRSFLVFLDIHGSRVGARLTLPMIRVMGATEVFPGGRSGPYNNPLNEVEHRAIMRQAKHDRAVGKHYGDAGDKFKHGEYTGRALRAQEIAHNYSPISRNPSAESTWGRATGRQRLAMLNAVGMPDDEAGLFTSRPWSSLPTTTRRRLSNQWEFAANPSYLRPSTAKVYCSLCGQWSRAKGPYRTPEVGSQRGKTLCDLCYRGWRSGRRSGEKWAKNPRTLAKSNPGKRRKVTMSLKQFAELIKKKRDPKLWQDFLKKVQGYKKWSHGTLPSKVTVELVEKPGMSGVWIAYDMGKQPESTYIMPSGTKRTGAWKHPWEKMPRMMGDPESGIIMTKLVSGNKITDFLRG